MHPSPGTSWYRQQRRQLHPHGSNQNTGAIPKADTSCSIHSFPNPDAGAPMTLFRWSRHAVHALAFVILAVACQNTAGPIPGGIDAVYVARTVNGTALPATAYKAPGDEYILIADTLRF